MRALIDWSYDLLSQNEKRLLARLSVFLGGWALEAAESVTSGSPLLGQGGNIEDWEVLDLLMALEDKSLVLAEQPREGRTRYRLLETVRQYARDRLLENREEATWRDRHRDHFLALAEEGEPNLTGPDQVGWLQHLEIEHDNLRAALERSAQEEEVGEVGLRLSGSLWRFWLVRGHLSEGRIRLQGALDSRGAHGRTGARGKALNAAGLLALRQGDYLAAARPLYEESLSIQRAIGDRLGIALTLGNLGTIAEEQGQYAVARPLYEEGLAVCRELGDQQGTWLALYNLGLVAVGQSDYRSARALLEESLTVCRELDDRRGIAFVLESLANLCSLQEGAERAAQLWGVAQSLREAIGAPMPPKEREKYDLAIAAVRQALGEEAFSAAWAEGRALPLEQAIAQALE